MEVFRIRRRRKHAQGGGAVIADEPTREANQDRRQGDEPSPTAARRSWRAGTSRLTIRLRRTLSGATRISYPDQRAGRQLEVMPILEKVAKLANLAVFAIPPPTAPC